MTILNFPAVATAADEETVSVRTFTGTVLMPDGSPAEGAVVRNLTLPALEDVKTDATGQYRIRIDKKSLSGCLVFETADRKLRTILELPYQADLTSVPNEEVLNDATLKPARTFTTKVVDEAGVPISGAGVCLQAGHGIIDQHVTGESGVVTMHYQEELSLDTIGAVKPDVGCDYQKFKDLSSSNSHANDLPQEFTGEVTLTLDGVKTLTVKVIGPDSDVIKGINFQPWMISKPGRSDVWNHALVPEFSSLSDTNGIATFNSIPHDIQNGLIIWPRNLPKEYCVKGAGYEAATFNWNEDKTSTETTIELLEKVHVGGTITLPNGKPGENITVRTNGGTSDGSGFHESATSNEHGYWNMIVKPNGYYIVAIEDNTYAAAAQNGIFVLDHGAMLKGGLLPAEKPGVEQEQMLLPAPSLDFQLQPALKIYGKVTGFVTENMWITLQLKGDIYYDLPQELQILNVEGNTIAFMPSMSRSAMIQPDGTYEFNVGPGSYTIWNPQRSDTESFELTSESKEINFEVERPLNGPVTIQLATYDLLKPLANVKVKARGLINNSRSRWKGVTDKTGTLTRPLEPVLVVAESEDKQWAGFGKMTADDTDLKISMKPTTIVTGQFVDLSKEPIADAILTIGIQVTTPNGLMSHITEQTVTTDAEGRFEVNGLCMGIKHHVHRMNLDEQGKPRGRTVLKAFTPQSAKLDLQEITNKQR